MLTLGQAAKIAGVGASHAARRSSSRGRIFYATLGDTAGSAMGARDFSSAGGAPLPVRFSSAARASTRTLGSLSLSSSRSSGRANHALTQELYRRLDAAGFIEERATLQPFSPTDGRFLQDRLVEGICPACGCLPSGTERNRLHRGAKRRDRIPLG